MHRRSHRGTGDQAEATAALTAAGIQPVTKGLHLDLGALVSNVSPDGTFFAHDKVEAPPSSAAVGG